MYEAIPMLLTAVSRGVKGRGAVVESNGAASAKDHNGERENKEYEVKEMQSKGRKQNKKQQANSGKRGEVIRGSYYGVSQEN